MMNLKQNGKISGINRLDFIDALRGMAACMVIFFHTLELVRLPQGYFKSLALQGSRGVELFFIISSFTLFLSLRKRLKKEKNPIANFFLRRFFRIAPLFYISLIIYLFMYGLSGVSRLWLGVDSSISFANIITNIFFINAWFPKYINSINPIGWTIAVEMGFYLFVPILFRHIKNLKSSLYWLFGSLFAGVALTAFLRSYLMVSAGDLYSSFLYFWLPYQLPVFLLGITFYHLYISGIKINKTGAKVLLLASILMLLSLLDTGGKYFINYFLYALIFFIMMLAITQFPTKLIVNKVSIYMGKISYGLYLSHYIILLLLLKFSFIHKLSANPLNFILIFLLLLVCSMIISTYTYYFIELPFQFLGKHIINALNNPKQKIWSFKCSS